MNPKRVGMAAAAVALATGVGLSYRVSAQEPTATPTAPGITTPQQGTAPDDSSAPPPRGHHRGPADGARHEAHDAALAEALGITVERLQAAREAARTAVEAQESSGTTTSNREARRDAYDAALAAELGITVEQLGAARESAETKALSDALAAGTITQQQADAMSARRALRDALDERALVAQVLGMSVEEMEQAHQNGQRLDDLLAAKGMTDESFRTAMQAAINAKIDEAVAAGTITQAQADALKAEGMRGPGGGRDGRGPRGGRHHGPRGGEGEGSMPSTAPTPGSDS